ncbi:DUF402 domain-containing protein [Nocardioides mangrovi]|uniref:DUF402 domain-containing protein n=1 Tax=Nocardioides mangrovi TaxID=2874580 RepID=A0ABS7UA89_9ACTN|nr:DUF402 domain-containing protein [Nocardioides mangrovi]MBZ5737608.1 DUF402 domain-containing protein [Nocardioides mangrovi]
MTPDVSPAPGDAVRLEMTKWGDRPHWELDAIFLGSDDHGDWIGAPAGTLNARPGARFVSEVDAVTLVPRAEHLAWCLPTFQAPGIWCTVYVDVATPAAWDGRVLRSVDLDLDVIHGAGHGGRGRIWVDDEDEFADHRVRFGYPDDVVAAAVASAERVLAEVTAGLAPFDGTADAWLARLAALDPT